jgi:hypothetical protein
MLTTPPNVDFIRLVHLAEGTFLVAERSYVTALENQNFSLPSDSFRTCPR